MPLLYDVFYSDGNFDQARPLPNAGPAIKYARCVNGADQVVEPFQPAIDGAWAWRDKPQVCPNCKRLAKGG